jgi:colanic acid biosynthesis glycosyl transferase WcaI
MVELLLRKGVVEERAEYFPNWVDVSHVKPALCSETYRLELDIPSAAVVVLFAGSLSGKQGLMVIPEIAAHLAHRKDIVFVVCGEGVMKGKLEAAAAGLANVRFLPLQPFDRLGELLCLADIHLLPQSADAADLVLPSKLSGMLASGRPVISTCRPGTEIGSVVAQCGMVVPPADSKALADAIGALADDPDRRAELGRAGRAFAEAHFELDSVLERRFAPLEVEVEEAVGDAVG